MEKHAHSAPGLGHPVGPGPMRTPVRLLCLLVVALSGCALRHEVTRDEIQAQLAAHFPIEKRGGLWRVQISEPRLRLTGQNRAGLELSVSAGGAFVPTVGASADVEGTPEYRSAEGAFYLKDFTIRRLTFTGQPGDLEVPLRAAVGVAIENVLRDQPVFVLDPKRSDTERLFKGHVRRIWVEQDRLVVEYHL
jgi:hypothetical protein